MIEFSTFCQLTSLIQVASIKDDEMNESLVELYKKYLGLTSEERKLLENSWADKITVPMHKLVKFYNETAPD